MAALEDDEAVRSAAKRFGALVVSAVRIGQRRRLRCRQVPLKIGGICRAALAGESGAWLPERLVEKPNLTVRALTADLAA